MKFENISNTYTNEINMTHLQGDVNISYGELVDIFGEPSEGDGYKVQKQWVIKFADGTIATIYDWKWSKEYNGDYHGKHYTMVPEWHIGGVGKTAVDYVHDTIRENVAIVGTVAQKALPKLSDEQCFEEVLDDAFDTCLNDSGYMKSLLREYFSTMNHDEIRQLLHDAFGDRDE